MKKILSIIFLASVFAGCQSATQQTVNTNSAVQKADNSAMISGHSGDSEGAKPPVNPANNSVSGGSPMAKAVDVGEMTANIEIAEKNYEAKPNDEKVKTELSKAYFARAFSLTEAAQYRVALGDFRKGLKLNPNDTEAKKMHDEILRIFKSINREPPKEGEEPAPMPLKN